MRVAVSLGALDHAVRVLVGGVGDVLALALELAHVLLHAAARDGDVVQAHGRRLAGQRHAEELVAHVDLRIGRVLDPAGT